MEKPIKIHDLEVPLFLETPIYWSNFIETSHDRFTPQKEGKSPAISGKSRLVKYYNLARYIYLEPVCPGWTLEKKAELPIKTRVIWVPGIYTYMYIYIYTVYEIMW